MPARIPGTQLLQDAFDNVLGWAWGPTQDEYADVDAAVWMQRNLSLGLRGFPEPCEVS